MPIRGFRGLPSSPRLHQYYKQVEFASTCLLFLARTSRRIELCRARERKEKKTRKRFSPRARTPAGGRSRYGFAEANTRILRASFRPKTDAMYRISDDQAPQSNWILRTAGESTRSKTCALPGFQNWVKKAKTKQQEVTMTAEDKAKNAGKVALCPGGR